MMFLLSLLPAIILLVIIYKTDKREKEPIGLLAKLFILGVLSTFAAAIIGQLGDAIVTPILGTDSLFYLIIDNFILTALVEEFGKYFVVKATAWKSSAFNYTFDAIVYAVFASLGFAAFENVLYLSSGSFSLAIMRGIFAVPGHAIDAVFMGYYFGLAKRYEVIGNLKLRGRYLRLALIVPVLLHGFYDFCVSSGSDILLLVFFVYEAVITIVAIRKVKKLSKEDTAFFQGGYPGATYVQNMYSTGVIKYDPATGKPYYVDPTRMNFDPMTGQRLNGPRGRG